MIEFIEGKLVEKSPAHAVISANGIAYFMSISLHTYSAIPDQEFCRLYTHLSIREDAHTLYGFATKEERHTFRMLISVSGVGAATARMILSSLSPGEIHQAIAQGNVAQLKNVKGIGEKSAQRIIVDLKGKLSKQDMMPEISYSAGNKLREEALAALLMLGFARANAEKALEKAMHSEPGQDVSLLVKMALKNL